MLKVGPKFSGPLTHSVKKQASKTGCETPIRTNNVGERHSLGQKCSKLVPSCSKHNANSPPFFYHKGVEISKKMLKKNLKIPIALLFGHKGGGRDF